MKKKIIILISIIVTIIIIVIGYFSIKQFRKAILNQLLMQVRNQKGVEVNANGSTTDNGEIVYAFITKNNDVITTQYYIVGDYKFILIQETLFEESEETKKVTKNIIDSFKWKEQM